MLIKIELGLLTGSSLQLQYLKLASILKISSVILHLRWKEIVLHINVHFSRGLCTITEDN